MSDTTEWQRLIAGPVDSESLVEIMVALTALSREKGILEIGPQIAELPPEAALAREGVSLVMDRAVPEWIEQTLTRRVDAELAEKRRQLEITKAGTLAISAGDNPRIVQMKLETFFSYALPSQSTLPFQRPENTKSSQNDEENWKHLLAEPFNTRALVNLLIALAETARKKGILETESQVDELPPEAALAREGLAFVMDGTDPEFIETLLDRRIEAELAEKRRQLAIMKAGVMAIAANNHPTIVRMELGAFFPHGDLGKSSRTSDEDDG